MANHRLPSPATDNDVPLVAMSDAWEPETYARFKAERAQPFHDLLSLVEPSPSGRGVDLGCGTGELTALAQAQLGLHHMMGLDSSPAMLDKAAAHATERCSFREGDIATWTAHADHDVVIANASLQWVGDHPAVLARWAAALAPGGQLAVQVPANADAPSHLVAQRVAQEAPFATAFGAEGAPPDPVASNVLAPERYATLLHELGFGRQHVRLQVYGHVLGSSADVVEWVRGTTLTRFQSRLPAPLFEVFVNRYRDVLLAEIGRHTPYFFPFRRILIWARLDGTLSA